MTSDEQRSVGHRQAQCPRSAFPPSPTSGLLGASSPCIGHQSALSRADLHNSRTAPACSVLSTPASTARASHSALYGKEAVSCFHGMRDGKPLVWSAIAVLDKREQAPSLACRDKNQFALDLRCVSIAARSTILSPLSGAQYMPSARAILFQARDTVGFRSASSRVARSR